MTTCLGKSCSFGLLCLSFVTVYEFVCASLPFGFEGAIGNLFVLIPDYCLSISSLQITLPLGLLSYGNLLPFQFFLSGENT